MLRLFWTASWALALFISLPTLANAQNAPEKPKPTLDLINLAHQTYIFQLEPDTSPAEVQRIAREAAGIGGGRPTHIYTAVMRGFSAQVSDADLVEIQEEFPEIVAIQRSNIFTISKGKPPSTPGGGGGGDTTTSGETIPWGVARVLPKNSGETVVQNGAASGRTLWVLDTGVDLDNPDLNVDNTGKNKNCVAAIGFRGKDTPDDENGHGTHVAGTAAAIAGNNTDVVGVAAGAPVVSVRVLDRRGSGTTAEVVCGINYVVENRAANSPGDVINMSLGGPADQILDDAVVAAANAGILFSLAAGNEGTDAGTRSPARVRHANVYTVSAIDSGDNFASFSNYRNPPVDRAAPGVGVVSLKRGGGTDTKSGTSMAAPHVAGLLILHGDVGCQGTASGDLDGTDGDAIAYLEGTSCPLPDSPSAPPS